MPFPFEAVQTEIHKKYFFKKNTEVITQAAIIYVLLILVLVGLLDLFKTYRVRKHTPKHSQSNQTWTLDGLKSTNLAIVCLGKNYELWFSSAK